MPAHSSVQTHTDTLYAISAALPVTYDAAGYGSTLMVYTAIDKVTDFTPYGSERPVSEFVPIAGAVEYIKGSPRYGSGDIMMADMPADAGQVILRDAEASQNHYSMKVTYPDGEIHYLDVINSSWRISAGKEGAAMTRTGKLSICKKPVVVAAV